VLAEKGKQDGEEMATVVGEEEAATPAPAKKTARAQKKSAGRHKKGAAR
jgi:hypothetical protein